VSAQQCFALCIDCFELHYGISDSNGVYSRDSGSSNHFDHAVHVFGRPDDYPPPIRNILACLQAGLPISDGRMAMFSLACAVTAIQPNNGVAVTFGQPPPEPQVAEQAQTPVDGLVLFGGEQ
jgi:hypothetical protein